MAEKKHGMDKHATILGVIGVIFFIIGVCIISIRNPLRGSGLGTISTAIGVVLIIISILRYSKRK